MLDLFETSERGFIRLIECFADLSGRQEAVVRGGNTEEIDKAISRFGETLMRLAKKKKIAEEKH